MSGEPGQGRLGSSALGEIAANAHAVAKGPLPASLKAEVDKYAKIVRAIGLKIE